MKVPESLREEHEFFMERLKRYSARNDETGKALRQLLELLEPHVQKEDELVLPLLGAIGGVAAGTPLESSGAVMSSYKRYAAQYDNMFAEHFPIRKALMRAVSTARREGCDDVVETLDALEHHARVEEEVLYPAALLVGRATFQSSRKAGGQGSNTAPLADIDRDGGLSYYAIDYEAPISRVMKTLMVRHRDIEELLSEVEDLVERRKPRVAISLLNVAAPLILRSAVEEEARVMRVVMQKNKSKSQRSVAIAREHRAMVDFLKHELPTLGKSTGGAGPRILQFVKLLRNHLAEEEEVEFPLAASDQ